MISTARTLRPFGLSKLEERHPETGLRQQIHAYLRHSRLMIRQLERTKSCARFGSDRCVENKACPGHPRTLSRQAREVLSQAPQVREFSGAKEAHDGFVWGSAEQRKAFGELRVGWQVGQRQRCMGCTRRCYRSNGLRIAS